MPTRQVVINGSLNDLSSLSLLKKNSRFIRAKSKNSFYDPVAVKFRTQEGQIFRISGDIELTNNGRIRWKKSNINRINFKDTFNHKNNYRITDYWQFGFSLKSLINETSENRLRLLLKNDFALRGGARKDVIDLTSTLVSKRHEWLPISGGAGADLIIGSRSNDHLAASTSRDICDFGTGTNLAQSVKDVLTGNAGTDTFYADNGTHITDVEAGEVIHLFNHKSYDLTELSNKSPSFKHKRNKTIIKVGGIRITTNPAKFDFSYKFYDPKYTMCRTDSDGTTCDMGWIPGEPEGYSFTAIEIM